MKTLLTAVPFCLLTSIAAASPWVEVGDAQMRSDIQILAAAGAIDDVTSQYPLPWADILSRLRDQHTVEDQPTYVREARARVLRAAESATAPESVRATATLDVTNMPGVVYGFDGLGRGKGQAQLSSEYMTGATAVRVSLGAFSPDLTGRNTRLMLDNSYVAERVGGALVYAGYLSHWWGPGWISALTLSNNARPFPQIGIARDGTSAFESPWLSWLGPWHAEFIVGLLDDKRVAENTLWDGLRITLNPLPGLQIGIARSEELCGKGHPCKPLATYFDLQNTPSHPSRTASEGVFDIHYANILLGHPFELYTQIMNEDSNPITHSFSSHLFGSSIWFPVGDLSTVRLTGEYTDSISTRNIFSFGNLDYGVSYTDYKYPGDGMRYRGRTLGFSLDSDSRLLSIKTSYLDRSGWSYTLTYDRAQISTPFTGSANIVTTAPVTVNMGEGRIAIPLSVASLDFAVRLQDDQPRPKRGFAAAFETAVRFAL